MGEEHHIDGLLCCVTFWVQHLGLANVLKSFQVSSLFLFFHCAHAHSLSTKGQESCFLTLTIMSRSFSAHLGTASSLLYKQTGQEFLTLWEIAQLLPPLLFLGFSNVLNVNISHRCATHSAVVWFAVPNDSWGWKPLYVLISILTFSSIKCP